METGVRLEPALAGAGLAAGFALILVRPYLIGDPQAVPVLGLIYVALAAVSLTAPTIRENARLAWPAVLAMGLAALAVAAATAGPRAAVPTTSATIPLGLAAAVAEEAFFRRFLYARLVRFGAGAAVVVSALAFALVHVPAYGPPVFFVDLGAGLLLSWQRWASGTWTVPAATHGAANLLAVLS